MNFNDIKNAIIKSVRDSGQDSRRRGFWKKPLVSRAAADDRRFGLLKEAVSPGHLLPRDILPGARTVICFFIPFAESVIQSNAAGCAASNEWARAYIETNKLIADISENLARLLDAAGFRAGQIPATHNFDAEKLVSGWSHRHAACIAGMGSFGVNNMLITDAGCCGRFGSLVTDWEGVSRNAAPEPRERCLAKLNGGCGICRAKCPAGAYTDGMFNRHACYARCLENARLHGDIGFADVCGKCLCALPCSSASPARAQRFPRTNTKP